MKATPFPGRLSENQTALKVINHLEKLGASADTAHVVQADGPTNYVLVFSDPRSGDEANWSAEPFLQGLNEQKAREKVEAFLAGLTPNQTRTAKIVASQGHPAFVIYKKA